MSDQLSRPRRFRMYFEEAIHLIKSKHQCGVSPSYRGSYTRQQCRTEARQMARAAMRRSQDR